MNLVITSDYAALSSKAAHIAAEYIRQNPDTLVCFAAGDTPLGMFNELIAMQKQGAVDLSSVWYAELDEWVGLGPDDPGSCIKVMTDAFYGPAGIPGERVRLFDGLDAEPARQCRQMEDWIAAHGGIGFTVLGIGMNGHIGFNEPGAPDRAGCFTVPLDEVTKSVSAKYFGKTLPVHTGITIGWRTLLGAKSAVLLADGQKKAPIVRASLEGPVTAEVPASLFQNHPALTIVLDTKAAEQLERP